MRRIFIGDWRKGVRLQLPVAMLRRLSIGNVRLQWLKGGLYMQLQQYSLHADISIPALITAYLLQIIPTLNILPLK